jgi:ribosome-associated protein
LTVAEPIEISEAIFVPAKAIQMKAVRSGGPGGQNVNKVASKVELRIDLERIEGLDDGARQRLRQAVRNQLDAQGIWIVVSSLTRDQIKNLEDARGKVVRAIEKALSVPKHRTPTRPTRSSQNRRVETKKRTAEIKQGRRIGSWE